MQTVLNSSFDPIAALYHRLWSDWYLPAAMPALEKLLFQRLPPPARLLDVCCGSGHVTKEFVRRGYQVTGVDGSEKLLSIAQAELPCVKFHLEDVRALQLSQRFEIAVSTFDSLNHILSLEDLGDVFHGVHKSLEPQGYFVFDMNLEEAFSSEHRGWNVFVDDANASLIRGSFEREQQLARTELIWFHRDAGSDGTDEIWRRNASAIEERCYREEEIVDRLSRAGFRDIDYMTAAHAGMDAQLGLGRIFVTAIA